MAIVGHIEELPSEMLYEISTTYRMGCVELYGARQHRARVFGYGVARLMAMTCKTMQRAVEPCRLEPLNRHWLLEYSKYWYAWFATVGDRPLRKEHIRWRGNHATGLCRDANKNWLASPMTLPFEADTIAPVLIGAVVFARKWDQLSCLVPQPLSLGMISASMANNLSLLVDIAGRPGMEHVTDDARMAYLGTRGPTQRVDQLMLAVTKIARTVAEHEQLSQLFCRFNDYNPIERFSRAVEEGADLAFLRATWTRLNVGKIMAIPHVRSLWGKLISSNAPVEVYEWMNTTVCPLEELYHHTGHVLLYHIGKGEYCSVPRTQDGRYSLMAHVGEETPLEAIEWLCAHGQSIDVVCGGCKLGLVGMAMQNGNLPVVHWALARTTHLSLASIGRIHAFSFSASELWLLYDYAVTHTKRAATVKLAHDHGRFGDLCKWLIHGAAVSPAVLEFVIARVLPDARLTPDDREYLLGCIPAAIIKHGRESADPVVLLKTALSAWAWAPGSQWALREGLLGGLQHNATELTRRERAAVDDFLTTITTKK